MVQLATLTPALKEAKTDQKPLFFAWIISQNAERRSETWAAFLYYRGAFNDFPGKAIVNESEEAVFMELRSLGMIVDRSTSTPRGEIWFCFSGKANPDAIACRVKDLNLKLHENGGLYRWIR